MNHEQSTSGEFILRNFNAVGKDHFTPAHSVESALEVCSRQKIDLIIMDLELPDTKNDNPIDSIKNSHPQIEILVLADAFDKTLLQKILEKDIAGFVLKDSGKKELLKAIEHICNGEKYYSNEITYQLIKKIAEQESKRKRAPAPNSLTSRELEILKLICQELTNQEIAEELEISVRTVDSHRRNLMQETGARNTAGLVRFAVEQKLV